jgi:hypothetical protein
MEFSFLIFSRFVTMVYYYNYYNSDIIHRPDVYLK